MIISLLMSLSKLAAESTTTLKVSARRQGVMASRVELEADADDRIQEQQEDPFVPVALPVACDHAHRGHREDDRHDLELLEGQRHGGPDGEGGEDQEGHHEESDLRAGNRRDADA